MRTIDTNAAAREPPLVSIGMPVYNEARHLARALEALLAQDYEHFEVLVLDNASDDATPQIVREFAARDPRVSYRRNETNVGGLENFNRAFGGARGEYFLWAAGHDLRHPSFISRCVAVLEADASVVLCYPQSAWLGVDGAPCEINHRSLDTRGNPDALARLNAVLWGLTDGFPIYGVHRVCALARTRLYQPVVSPDATLLAELSLLGSFAQVSEPLFYAHKPDDAGDWSVYVAKHFRGVGGWRAQSLYWRMVRELIRAAVRHVPGVGGKAAGVISVLLCMLTRYRWLLTGLWSLRKQPRPDVAVTEAKR